MSWPRRLVGLISLAVATAACALLVLQLWQRIELPGCGADSDCAELAAGPWGAIGGWPLAYLGLAYFAGLLVAWLLTPSAGFPRLGKWGVRLGLAASLALVAVMADAGLWCPYCIAVHAANVVFWGVIELTPTGRPSRRVAAGFLIAFLNIAAATSMLDDRLRAKATDRGESELRAAVQTIIERTRAGAASPQADAQPFIGRYVRGPEQAKVRLVLFTDYQCRYCQTLDGFVADAIAGRDDVSLSIKHFPLCRECNPSVDLDRHPLACRAAYIAEAAGLCGGKSAFWKMHAWLTARLATFRDQQLTEALPSIGVPDAEAFWAKVKSDEVRARVQKDIQEALELGVNSTPVLYVNGVELSGLAAQGIERAMELLDEADLPLLTASDDRPRTVTDRLVAEWRAQPKADLKGHPARWSIWPKSSGPSDTKPPVHVTVFIDALSAGSLEVTRNLRELSEARGDVRIDVYHFPANETNLAGARFIEAVAQQASWSGLWQAHDWLAEHGADKPVDDWLAAAATWKIDGRPLDQAKLKAAMASGEIAQAVQADIQLGVQADAGAAPRIYVNGRRLSADKPSRQLIQRVLASAAEGH